MTQTYAERQESLALMRSAAEELKQAIAGLSATQLTTRYILNEWTVAQNVHHMPDSHAFALNNVLIALTEERPVWRDYEVDGIANLQDSSCAAVVSSLAYFEHLQNRWVRLFESLTDAQYARMGIASWGEFSVDDTLRIYARHTRKHVTQIAECLAAAR